MHRSVAFSVIHLFALFGWQDGLGTTFAADGCLRAPGLSNDERTRVFVLGTIHFRQHCPDDSTPKLGELLDRLERFNPTAIAVEQLPGDSIEALEQKGGSSKEIVEAFGGSAVALGKSAQEKLGIGRRGAEKEACKMVNDFEAAPDQVSMVDRLRLIQLLNAAYDAPTSMLQLSYAMEGKTAPPGSKEIMVEQLLRGHDESVEVGVAVAKRLKMQRLYSIDDQSDALFQLERGEQLMRELEGSGEFEKLKKSFLHIELPERIDDAFKNQKLLELFRWINSPAYASKDVDAQWHIFHRTKLTSGLDRKRAALWEARNLRIAANIREIPTGTKGQRILVIIGASHKPFLDSYLSNSMDVEIVPADEVLGR